MLVKLPLYINQIYLCNHRVVVRKFFCNPDVALFIILNIKKFIYL